jgi:hypothetical protein
MAHDVRRDPLMSNSQLDSFHKREPPPAIFPRGRQKISARPLNATLTAVAIRPAPR